MRGREGYEAPPREKLERMTPSDVMREYDVSQDTATRWLSEHDLYEPNQDGAGVSSELGRKLVDADPEDLGAKTSSE